MGMYQFKKLLHIKGNENEDKTHRMGKNFASYSLDKGKIFRIYKEIKNNAKRIII
jgi:hypothetical protein